LEHIDGFNLEPTFLSWAPSKPEKDESMKKVIKKFLKTQIFVCTPKKKSISGYRV
jgi:hypothetical protein